MKNKLQAAIRSFFALALALAVAALAATPARAADVRPMLKAGVDFGGDPVIKVPLSDGSTRTIRANEGFFLGGGASIVNEEKDLEAEISLSLKGRAVNADNGNVTWTTVPLDALVFYRLPSFRLGGGLTYHINPQLSGSEAGATIVSANNAQFDNALGVILQADYRFGDKIGLGLRLTGLKYHATVGGASTTYKGGGAGIVFSVSF